LVFLANWRWGVIVMKKKSGLQPKLRWHHAAYLYLRKRDLRHVYMQCPLTINYDLGVVNIISDIFCGYARRTSSWSRQNFYSMLESPWFKSLAKSRVFSSFHCFLSPCRQSTSKKVSWNYPWPHTSSHSQFITRKQSYHRCYITCTIKNQPP
jgi:hypothetical protein